MRISKIRQKSFIVVGQYAKIVSEYAKIILACTEYTLKACKRLRRIRQEYFDVYGEYADRHKTEPLSAKNFQPKPKKSRLLNPHSTHDRIGKTISRYCPFKEEA
jgi:hypothetical protein